MLPFATSYTQMVIFVLLMGPFSGCGAILFNCLVGDSIGMRRIPLAFGIVGTVNGGFFFTKPFFFGYFRDVVQSYDGMFHLTGAMIVFTGELLPSGTRVHLVSGFSRKREINRNLQMPTKFL